MLIQATMQFYENDIIDRTGDPLKGDRELMKFYNNICDLALGISGAETAVITLFQQYRKINVFASSSDIPANFPSEFLQHQVHDSSPDPFVIEDASRHEMLFNEPFVTEAPFMRGYIGIPVTGNNGVSLGTLSLVSSKTATTDAVLLNLLRGLAAQLSFLLSLSVKNLDNRSKIKRLAKKLALLEETNKVAKIGAWEVDLVANNIYWSGITREIHGVGKSFIPDMKSGILFYKEGESREKIQQCIKAAIENKTSYDEELQIVKPSGEDLWVRVKGTAEFRHGRCVRMFGTFQDIQQQKEQQSLLKSSEVRYRSIIENSFNAYMLTKPDGSILDVNSAAEKMFGYTVDEFRKIGRNGIVDMSDPRVEELLEKRRREGYVQAEFTGIRKNGERFPFFFSSSIFTDQQGQTLTALSGIDETERKKFMEELRSSKEEFSNAFDYAAIGMALVSLDGKWLKVNKSLCNMLEYSVEEFESLTFQDITHPDDLDADLQYLKCMITNEIESYQMEKRYITKSGNILWINLSVSKVSFANGSINHFISQIENISDKKKNAELLQLSERRFKGLFNTSFQLMGLLAPDGTLLEVNETALQFAGLKQKDVVGTKFWDCFWWQHAAEVRDTLRMNIEKAAQGVFIQYEVENVDKDGQLITVLFNLKPLFDERGNVIAIIPEGRPIQDIVNARESLLEKNRELEQFAAIASHDLQEPLRTIQSFMQLLKQRYGPQLDDNANKFIAFSIDGATRMRALITDLLSYAMVGGKEAKREWISTNGLLQEIQSFRDNQFSGHESHIEIGPVPDIYGIRVTIRLLFQNLISNAIKYHSKHSPTRISITAREQDNFIEFAVKDNGIGIKKEYFEQIFYLFKRLHNRKEYAGTGLGLATCKKIVELHGGKIWVESAVGFGSTFYFTIRKTAVEL